MAVSLRGMMAPSSIDPLTKNLENPMENVPTNKQLVRCDDCDLPFTSQTVLEAHLQGARHAKQMRSKGIMASLEETKAAFTQDQEANALMCNVCNVCLNSIQQLQTHMNGNRHKKKARKGGWNDDDDEEGPQVSRLAGSSSPDLSKTNGSKSLPLSCDACNKIFNSIAQYKVHTASRKHIQKTKKMPVKNNRKRFSPYQKKYRNDNGNCGYNRQALTNNFVPGGYHY